MRLILVLDQLSFVPCQRDGIHCPETRHLDSNNSRMNCRKHLLLVSPLPSVLLSSSPGTAASNSEELKKKCSIYEPILSVGKKMSLMALWVILCVLVDLNECLLRMLKTLKTLQLGVQQAFHPFKSQIAL